ncbi:hypothetical protein [Flammeovirga sp. SJP92]|uniref:hypothetical protein n=1 Tax=Flammeovirga sp. SJP92 TaxID=1775430 RepID=UPI000787784C|nr:hypothetical protein [Flammeovirga sp. SJP92]KXX66620.1 hypothetical protein AVL50_31490 [Flammeovirga sp. SJP92]
MKMIENLPLWIESLFVVTYFATIILFHFSNGKSNQLTFVIILWSVVQSVLAFSGFYQDPKSIPPRFALVLIPATAFIIYGIMPKPLQRVAEHRNRTISTFSHTIRFPIEIVLFGLYLNKMIPELMTFEGRNFDIIMGITAPIMGILIMRGKVNKPVLLVWNIIGLFLVLFILTNGILSTELPFQQFGFEQPNRAINFFPYVLLPATIVPIVVWTHLTDILILIKK